MKHQVSKVQDVFARAKRVSPEKRVQFDADWKNLKDALHEKYDQIIETERMIQQGTSNEAVAYMVC